MLYEHVTRYNTYSFLLCNEVRIYLWCVSNGWVLLYVKTTEAGGSLLRLQPCSIVSRLFFSRSLLFAPVGKHSFVTASECIFSSKAVVAGVKVCGVRRNQKWVIVTPTVYS